MIQICNATPSRDGNGFRKGTIYQFEKDDTTTVYHTTNDNGHVRTIRDKVLKGEECCPHITHWHPYTPGFWKITEILR